MIRTLRILIARRRLERLIRKRRQSFEVQQFARRREAAKLGWSRRAGRLV